jgi:hypothetical protein
MINRRTFVFRVSGLVVAGAAGVRVAAQLPGSSAKPTPITVYKSSSCECCAKWVNHVRDNGFEPVVQDEEDMDAIKAQLGVPEGVRSCHTALVGKYLIEGHVPASDIQRLVKQQTGDGRARSEDRRVRGGCIPAGWNHEDVRALLAQPATGEGW